MELGRRIAALDVEARLAAEKAAAAAKDHAERHGSLLRLQTERAELLGGEETGAHRARIEETCRAAHQAYEAMRNARAEADKVKAACDERVANAARDVEKALTTLGTARTVFTGALAASGFRQEDVLPLLAMSHRGDGSRAPAGRAGADETARRRRWRRRKTRRPCPRPKRLVFPRRRMKILSRFGMKFPLRWKNC